MTWKWCGYGCCLMELTWIHTQKILIVSERHLSPKAALPGLKKTDFFPKWDCDSLSHNERSIWRQGSFVECSRFLLIPNAVSSTLNISEVLSCPISLWSGSVPTEEQHPGFPSWPESFISSWSSLLNSPLSCFSIILLFPLCCVYWGWCVCGGGDYSERAILSICPLW